MQEKDTAALVDVARSIVRGEIDLLFAVRKICDLTAHSPRRGEYPLILFRGIESETDAFALVDESNRVLYSDEFLRKQAAALEAYFARERVGIIKAAKHIIQNFS